MRVFFKKVFYLLTIFVACSSFVCIFGKKSGIEGNVYMITGNQMPSPDRPPAAPKGIKATVCIYELTNMSQVARQGQTAFYTAINTKLIRQVETGDKGQFKVKLPPGKYSVFVKTDQGFYSNNFDGQNNIYPVEVIKKKMSRVELRLDHEAAY